ncbi:SafA/ExsA family spore coat assembly protein [uncultured Ottowia sp.]|uniref:SafA/ExsA family spore coat assembly protein n=1 Tax=uncultured Ottowia sp. TaxID=543067 RepID=UPI00259200F9|nr:SafA/ExsA family spore coat assembly protein [uncultured Ottowia sp.]
MTAVNFSSHANAARTSAAGGSVSVQQGDTLSAIAARNGVSLQALLAANPQISNPDLIFAGDTINLPGGAGAAGGGAANQTSGVQQTAAASGAGGSQPSGMSMSQAGLDMVKKYEGLYTKAYRDPVGILTIGYGHTGSDVREGQTITEAQATELLRKDLGTAENAVRKAVKVPLTQGQFDALVSFTFNCGAGALQKSTLLQKLNAGDYAGAQAEFAKWNHGGGRVLPGLTRRRNEEAQMFGNQKPTGTSGAQSQQPSPAAPSTGGGQPAKAAGGSYTVKKGDTLWDIARSHGVSLKSLIAANPQIANPDLIYPNQKINLPSGAQGAGRTGGAGGTGGAQGTQGTSTPTPAGNGKGANTAAIAKSFEGRNASELKRSGALPMNPNVPNDVCCANFVSAVLQKNGLLSAGEHTDAVRQLDVTLRRKGWQPVSLANAKPGDVVIMERNGVSHTEIVASNENGKVTLIGSNNRNADGSQRITYDASNWWHNHLSAILTPPN